jgi:lipopolysaccharide/colanic/teichoic acid biosynthesis glycosyltransferase
LRLCAKQTFAPLRLCAKYTLAPLPETNLCVFARNYLPLPVNQKTMPRKTLIIFILDLLVLVFAFLLMVAYKPGSRNYLSLNYILGFSFLLVTWIVSSLSFKKYTITREIPLLSLLKNILVSNIATLAAISLLFVALQLTGYSRLVLFGTIIITTVAELIFSNLHYYLIHTMGDATDITNPPLKSADLRKAKKSIDYKEVHVDPRAIRDSINEEVGPDAFKFIREYADISDPHTLVLSTTTRFNVQLQPDKYYTKIINLKRINDIQYINKFFESVNRKLPKEGLFIGTAETKALRKIRILRKYWPGLNWVMYFIDFMIKRVFPKFIITKQIYFFLTRGENRVLTRAEVLGRLYSCGFEVVEEKFIGRLFYFVVRKIKSPAYNMNPTYGPFVKLERVGKGGKLIKVYKLRTMHPYAEYLQDYIYKKHDLREGGKFKDDFRISTAGKIFRTFWLDELPMIANFLKGDLKIVGVRPISKQYFNLYRQELREKRIKYRPGLVPPYYADMPKTLDEIQDSEMRYLEAYQKHPLRTDIRYFFKAFNNIIFKKARSG